MNTPAKDFGDRVAWGLWFVTLAVFLPVSRFDFVNYDDFIIVYERAQILSGISVRNLIWALSTLHGDWAYWMPLTWISHQLDCQFFGSNAGAHHLTNVFLHSTITFFLFAVLHRMTGFVWRSACVALLFALHPLHVETVAWVAERKSLVCSLFWMLTILAYSRYAVAPTWRNYLWVLLGCVGALMGKPMAVTLPFSLLLLDYWPLNRFQASVAAGDSLWRIGRRLVFEKIPLFALSVIGSFLAYLAQKQVGALRENVDFLFRVQNAVVAYWLYIRRVFWPDDLIVIYERHPWPLGLVAWGAIFLVIVSIVCVRLRKRVPYLLVGWLWYLGNLVPSIGLIQFGGQAMADRYTYIPLIGIFIMLVWGLPEFAGRLSFSPVPARCAVGGCGVVIFLALAFLTRHQLSFWKDGVTLFTHAVQIAPSSAKAHYLLGMNLTTANDYDLALKHAKESLRLDATKAESFCLLGTVFAKTGNSSEAKSNFEKALTIDPNEKKGLSGLAYLLSTVDEANIRDGATAVRVATRLGELTGNKYPNYLGILACSYAEAGRFEDAARTAEKALGIARDSGDVRWMTGLTNQLAFFTQGKAFRLPPLAVRQLKRPTDD